MVKDDVVMEEQSIIPSEKEKSTKRGRKPTKETPSKKGDKIVVHEKVRLM